MKSLTIDKAYDLLQIAPAVLLEDRVLEPHLLGLDDKEFLYFCWQEQTEFGDILQFEVTFNVEENLRCAIDGCDLILVNSEGEKEIITLLIENYAEKNIQ